MSTNYQLGKIYKIIDLDTNECYIGSTCEPTLARRLAKHVSNYKSYLKGKNNYVTSFEIIKRGDYDIVLIELFPCNSKDELHARESHHTQTIPCVNKVNNQGLMNKLVKEKYKKQYYKVNKDEIVEQKKQYNAQHKERIAEQRKQYYEANKEQIKEKTKQYSEANQEQIAEKLKQYRNANKEQIKEQHKQYYEANKEQIAEKRKQYREQHKEHIQKHNNAKNICGCGSCYRTADKARHLKSAKHIQWLNV